MIVGRSHLSISFTPSDNHISNTLHSFYDPDLLSLIYLSTPFIFKVPTAFAEFDSGRHFVFGDEA